VYPPLLRSVVFNPLKYPIFKPELQEYVPEGPVEILDIYYISSNYK